MLEKADALDLTSMITAARINRKSLSEKQIELLQRNANLQADIRLATAVTSDYPLAVSVWNSADFADALAALGAADNQTLVALDELYDEYADWEFQLNSGAERVKVFLGILPTPCLPSFGIQDVAKVDQAVADHERGVFKIVYNDYESACDDAKSAVSAVVDPLPSGRIKEAWKDWKTAEEKLETLRAEARGNLVELKAAERQLAQASTPGPNLAAKFTKAAERLNKAVKAFDTICETGKKLVGDADKDDATNAGNIFSNAIICGKKRESLGHLIEATASGQDPTADDAPRSLKRAATIAAALPGLVGQVGEVLQAGRKVPLSSLRLLQAQAAIDLEYAERKVTRQEGRVEQAQRAWRATLAEAHHLWQTRLNLCRAAATAVPELEVDSIHCPSMEIVTVTDPSDHLQVPDFVECRYKRTKVQMVPLKGTDMTIPNLVPSGNVIAAPDCLLGKKLAEALAMPTVANSSAGKDIKNALSHYYLV